MSAEEEHEILLKDWWTEHRGIFHKIARSFAPLPEDEADLCQEMLVQLWRSLPNYRSACQPSTWIYRVCFNTALSWRRGEKRRLSHLLPVTLPEETPSIDPQPDATGERAERLEALYSAIRMLTPADRSMVLMLLDGRSYQEISAVTGLTENHVGVSLTRIRKKLMNLIERKSK